MNNTSVFDYLGGRKFCLGIIALGIGTGVQLFGAHPVDASFAGLLIGIVGTFSVANAAITNYGPGQPDNSQQAPPAIDLSPIHSRVDELQAQVEANSETVANVATSAANNNKVLQALLNQQR